MRLAGAVGLRLGRRCLLAGTAAIAAVGGSGLLLTATATALPSACSQSGQVVSCRFTTGANPFTIPSGVHSILVVAVDAAGGTRAHDHAVVAGIPLTDLREWLGHADLATTSIYAR